MQPSPDLAERCRDRCGAHAESRPKHISAKHPDTAGGIRSNEGLSGIVSFAFSRFREKVAEGRMRAHFAQQSGRVSGLVQSTGCAVHNGQNVDRNRILNTEAASLVGSKAGLMIVWQLRVMSVSGNNGTR